MRIVLVTTGLLTGGGETQVAALAAAYCDAGHTVAVLNLIGAAQLQLDPRAILWNLSLHGKKPWTWIAGLARAKALLTAFAPDVVHSHMLKANLFARLVRAICPLPRLVCSAHSLREGGKLWMLLYRLTDGLADLTTHVSPEGRDYFVAVGAVPAARIALMPNGIDIQRFALPELARDAARAAWRAEWNVDDQTFVWLHVGRLAAEKAQHLLLEVFATLHRATPATRLVIVGDGPLRAALTAQAQALGLHDAVVLTGRRDDVPALLAAADGFVLSSVIEGAPLVLAEAMAAGLPVVTTAVSGAAMLVGEHGAIVPVGDASALSQAMRQTMAAATDERLRAVRARNRQLRCAHVTAHFALERIAADWLVRYTQLPPRTEQVPR